MPGFSLFPGLFLLQDKPWRVSSGSVYQIDRPRAIRAPHTLKGIIAMREKEKIPVRVKIINGKTVCICMKGCNRQQYCEADYVERDRFRGWESTMKRDKYGK